MMRFAQAVVCAHIVFKAARNSFHEQSTGDATGIEMARSRYRSFQHSAHTLPSSWRCQPLGVRGSPFGVTLADFSMRQNLQVSVVNRPGTG